MNRTTIQCPHCQNPTRIDLSFQLSTQKCDRCGVRLSAVNTGSQASKEVVLKEPPSWRRAAVGDWEDERPPKTTPATRPRGGWLAACASLLLVGGAIAHFASRRDSADQPEPVAPHRIAALDSPTHDLGEASTYRLLRARIDGASAVARQFLAAATPDDVLSLIQNREALEPTVREYYGTREGAGTLPHPPTSLLAIERQLWIDRLRTALIHYVGEGGRPRALALELTDDDRFLVEWPSAVAFNEVAMAKFVEERQTTPRLFRVLASLDDYYNLDFSDSREFLCIRLSDADDRNSFFGYVRRDSPIGEALLAVKLPTQPPGLPVLVRLRFPKPTRSDNQVEIAEFLGTGWVKGLAASQLGEGQSPTEPPAPPSPSGQ